MRVVRLAVPIILLSAVLGLSACGDSAVSDKKKEKGGISIDFDDDKGKAGSSGGSVNIDANSETGDVAVSIPGGFSARINKPGGFETKGKFDFDDVGTYPGAQFRGVKVAANTSEGHDDAKVVLRFSAPGDAAAVADWYQKAFEDKGRRVTRSGETLTGTTSDGEAFTLTMAPSPGGSTGVINIVSDGKKDAN
ncbi:hypothetical protein [Sandarakinorhabdus sp.]|uniref:hypothetical protein n=1 Tax=Sandarakinorhabdus sp. TaxID=1916663 RepID=UPI00286E78C9|nr:hypothetical protein [Sandarakinorhabdus sp.]